MQRRCETSVRRSRSAFDNIPTTLITVIMLDPSVPESLMMSTTLQVDKAVALADAQRLAAALQVAEHRLHHVGTAERRRTRELTRCQQAVALVSATKVRTLTRVLGGFASGMRTFSKRTCILWT
jgi:hypothetical protein